VGVCGCAGYLIPVSAPPGLDEANSQVTSQEEELKKLKQTLEIEKMKKAEAINKLTVVSKTVTFPRSQTLLSLGSQLQTIFLGSHSQTLFPHGEGRFHSQTLFPHRVGRSGNETQGGGLVWQHGHTLRQTHLALVSLIQTLEL